LGEQGVQSAKIISEKKKLKGEKTRERNQLQRDAFSDIQDLKSFLALQVTETKDQLETTIEAQRQQYTALRRQKGNITQIKGRTDCAEVSLSFDLAVHLKQINVSLKTSLG
jgi:hypothetical protein